jgi:protoporphyrinogen oxidase
MLKNESTVVIGAGPAGLTACIELIRAGEMPALIEASDKFGGISRTEERDGWRFDLGGHRFFTKNHRVQEFWSSILNPEEFRETKRQSRIFYRSRFYDYPLRPINALRNLGLIRTTLAIFSFLWVKIKPIKHQENFETWVASRFGWYLYKTFFKTYTEKVWGIPAKEIQADWAAQRIKNLSLFSAVLSAFFPKSFNQGKITTLIDQFHYPKFGPGMMWERCAEMIKDSGCSIYFQTRVIGIEKIRIGDVERFIVSLSDGIRIECENIISSMPLSELIESLAPSPPREIIDSSKKLRYRSFITVAIPVYSTSKFKDNWIYIHDPKVKVGRIQNFGSWSEWMVKDNYSCLGLEYFVDENDYLWVMEDSDLVNLAIQELKYLGLADLDEVKEGYVVRVPKAYPVYDERYHESISSIREFLTLEWPNLQTVGRNGLHRYNNQDHSMLTAMYAVDNIIFRSNKNVWIVNTENEYHENAGLTSDRIAPMFPSAEK